MANTSVFIPIITPVVTGAGLSGTGTVGDPLVNSVTTTIGDTQVAFGDGANTIGGDAGLTYDKTAKYVKVLGTNTTVTDPAVNNYDGLYVSNTVASNTGDEYSGLVAKATLTDAGSGGSNVFGVRGLADLVDSGTSFSFGIGGYVRGRTTGASTGDGAGVIGLRAVANHLGAGTAASAVGVEASASGGAGPITTAYGLRAGAYSGDTNYAIYTEDGGGLSRFGDGVVFSATNPHVLGAWWDNAGTLTRSTG